MPHTVDLMYPSTISTLVEYIRPLHSICLEPTKSAVITHCNDTLDSISSISEPILSACPPTL